MKSLKPLLLIPLLALACLQANGMAAEKSGDTGEVAAKLKAMENAWGDALLHKDHGVAVIKDMVADDFAGINSKGKVHSKSDLLQDLSASGETLTSSTTDSMQVHVYGGNVATVCGTSTEAGKDKEGKAFSHHYGWVDTWMERNGKWECIAEAGMLMPEKK